MTTSAIGATGGKLPGQHEPTAAEQAKTAGKQLEAFFLRQLLAETRTQGGGGLDGGFAGDTFKQMLDEAVADKVSASGSIGLADIFEKQLAGRTAEVHAPGAPMNPLDYTPRGALPLPGTPTQRGPELPGLPQLVMPVSGRAASGYGLRADPVTGAEVRNHAGVDLAAKTGTPVGAATGGTVTHAGPAGTYGNLVTIRHADGFETRYAHLSAVNVQKGDTVIPGQEIGKVGSTGHSTGPHLHFELRQGGRPIDPAPLLPLNRSVPRTNR